MKDVCILDYGSGNTRSVYNLVASISQNVTISNTISDIENASHIILPGVGSFGSSMAKIKQLIPMSELSTFIFQHKKPFLGICVGMQVLADIGFEFEKNDGLGWIPGSIDKIKCKDLPLPHVGWNDIQIVKDSVLLNGIDDGSDFYFVHSYVFSPVDKEVIVATTTYGETFCSMVERENIFGVQFHPEKSHVAGRKLMKNFLSI